MSTEKKTVERVDVEPGQVWADNDWRAEGRTLRVLSTHAQRWEDAERDAQFDHCYALCEVSTDRTPKPGDQYRAKPQVGKRTWISFHRFRPTSTGYRLVQPATPNQESTP
jgi:hypothetical protein